MKINFENADQLISLAVAIAQSAPEIIEGIKASFGALAGKDFTHAEFMLILNGYRAAAEARDKKFHPEE